MPVAPSTNLVIVSVPFMDYDLLWGISYLQLCVHSSAGAARLVHSCAILRGVGKCRKVGASVGALS